MPPRRWMARVLVGGISKLVHNLRLRASLISTEPSQVNPAVTDIYIVSTRSANRVCVNMNSGTDQLGAGSIRQRKAPPSISLSTAPHLFLISVGASVLELTVVQEEWESMRKLVLFCKSGRWSRIDRRFLNQVLLRISTKWSYGVKSALSSARQRETRT